jgi:A/G-specific adenine glycosylase
MPHTIDAGAARAIRKSLLSWFRQNGRDLPWRRTRDPYAILVSEFMLQQTTVSTVIPRYDAWLRRFPTVRSLAQADETEVLHAWQGLGYYTRARNLHRCAEISIARFGGTFAVSRDALQTLPGVGRYTANAVSVFAFDQPLPLVEANTARVLTRLFNIRQPIDSAASAQRLWDASAKLLPQRGAGDFYSAMMDLGALVCTRRQPRCRICPVQRFCTALAPETLPRKRAQPKLVRLMECHSFIRREHEILLTQCCARWRGMWMLPSIPVPAPREPIYSARFPFTHHQITLRIFASPVRRPKTGERWFAFDDIDRIPVPSPHRRAIEALQARLPLSGRRT